MPEQIEICDTCENTGVTEEMCVNCSGSGEGMYDGSSCSVCKGSGVIEIKCTDFPEEDWICPNDLI